MDHKINVLANRGMMLPRLLKLALIQIVSISTIAGVSTYLIGVQLTGGVADVAKIQWLLFLKLFLFGWFVFALILLLRSCWRFSMLLLKSVNLNSIEFKAEILAAVYSVFLIIIIPILAVYLTFIRVEFVL